MMSNDIIFRSIIELYILPIPLALLIYHTAGLGLNAKEGNRYIKEEEGQEKRAALAELVIWQVNEWFWLVVAWELLG